MSLIKNEDSRIPLVIVAVAASISWTYGVLKRLYGVLQMKLLPGRLIVSIVFFTLLLAAKAIYS